MSNQVSIALVSQNSILKEGIARILTRGSFFVARSVNAPTDLTDGSSTLRQPDLILFADAGAPANLECCERLRTVFPQTRIVVLAERFDLQLFFLATRAGVDGFLVAEISCDALIESLKLIVKGEKIWPSQLADALTFEICPPDPLPQQNEVRRPILSEREKQVLKQLATGSPNRMIARQLDITETAVKIYVKAVLRKLRAKNRTQAAIWAAKSGMRAGAARNADLRTMGRRSPSLLD